MNSISLSVEVDAEDLADAGYHHVDKCTIPDGYHHLDECQAEALEFAVMAMHEAHHAGAYRLCSTQPCREVR